METSNPPSKGGHVLGPYGHFPSTRTVRAPTIPRLTDPLGKGGGSLSTFKKSLSHSEKKSKYTREYQIFGPQGPY